MTVLVLTVSAAPTEKEAIEAYALANIAYTSSAAEASSGNIPGLTFSMNTEGMEYSFKNFDLSSLRNDPNIQPLLLGSKYKTVTGKLVVAATGTMKAEFTLTGGPVSSLSYTYNGSTVTITADGADYTY
ncbi:MAG: hypothetical protein ACLFSE_12100 [Spirochaetia bacterium]